MNIPYDFKAITDTLADILHIACRMKRFGLTVILSSLAACSGSIFTEGGGTPPAAPVPAPADGRPLVQDSSSSSSNGPAREVVVVPVPAKDPLQKARVVTDVRTLELFEILAPSKIAEWTEKMNDRKQKDFLARLALTIEIEKVIMYKDRPVRIVNFYIGKDGKNVSLGRPDAPWVSISMEVNKDEPENGFRALYLSGHLQSPDYPANESPFIALSLKLKPGKNQAMYLYDGKFIVYENGDPQPGYRISNNTLIKIRIQ